MKRVSGHNEVIFYPLSVKYEKFWLGQSGGGSSHQCFIVPHNFFGTICLESKQGSWDLTLVLWPDDLSCEDGRRRRWCWRRRRKRRRKTKATMVRCSRKESRSEVFPSMPYPLSHCRLHRHHSPSSSSSPLPQVFPPLVRCKFPDAYDIRTFGSLLLRNSYTWVEGMVDEHSSHLTKLWVDDRNTAPDWQIMNFKKWTIIAFPNACCINCTSEWRGGEKFLLGFEIIRPHHIVQPFEQAPLQVVRNMIFVKWHLGTGDDWDLAVMAVWTRQGITFLWLWTYQHGIKEMCIFFFSGLTPSSHGQRQLPRCHYLLLVLCRSLCGSLNTPHRVAKYPYPCMDE